MSSEHFLIKNKNLMQKGNKLTEIKFPKSVTRLLAIDNSITGGFIAKADAKNLAELVAQEDSLMAIFSHHLRSPLAGIVGMTEYLKSNSEKMGISVRKEKLNLIYESS